MVYAGNELPLVTQALIEEAKSGNVHAAKVILERFGKLTKNAVLNYQRRYRDFLIQDGIIGANTWRMLFS